MNCLKVFQVEAAVNGILLEFRISGTGNLAFSHGKIVKIV